MTYQTDERAMCYSAFSCIGIEVLELNSSGSRSSYR
jgi:hypothetical protein